MGSLTGELNGQAIAILWLFWAQELAILQRLILTFRIVPVGRGIQSRQ
ncbi:hypothetical protein [Synechocystis sp. CACIAM 05]|nr:hypothetical protein [Synechocystis sp. CACIAM 05]